MHFAIQGCQVVDNGLAIEPVESFDAIFAAMTLEKLWQDMHPTNEGMVEFRPCGLQVNGRFEHVMTWDNIKLPYPTLILGFEYEENDICLLLRSPERGVWYCSSKLLLMPLEPMTAFGSGDEGYEQAAWRIQAFLTQATANKWFMDEPVRQPGS